MGGSSLRSPRSCRTRSRTRIGRTSCTRAGCTRLWSSPDGSNINLYVTKDSGPDNWTLRPAAEPEPGPDRDGPVPVERERDSDERHGSGRRDPEYPGQLQLTLTVDATNPEVVYVGAPDEPDADPGGYQRAARRQRVLPGSALPDGGARIRQSNGAAQIKAGDEYDTPGSSIHARCPTRTCCATRRPGGRLRQQHVLCERTRTRCPTSGFGRQWTRLRRSHRWCRPCTGFFRSVDPITGRGRLIFGYDQGVATAVDNNGQLDFGIGTAVSVNGTRDGNLQINQFYYGASSLGA